MYLTQVLWLRHARLGGEIDAVEGIAPDDRESRGKGRQLATSVAQTVDFCAFTGNWKMQKYTGHIHVKIYKYMFVLYICISKIILAVEEKFK